MNFGKRTLGIISETPRFRKRLLAVERERNEILAEQLKVAREQLAATNALKQSMQQQRALMDNVRTAVMSDLRSRMRAAITSRQLGLMETVERIRDERLSFARFGDGEFQLMFRPEFSIRFQKNNPQLAKDLRQVLSAPADGVLLGLPKIYLDPHWSTIMAELWHEIEPTLADAPVFGDAHVSRPNIFKQHGEDGVKAWSSVWAGREAVVVAGKGSRFDLIDPLFGSLASAETVESLPTDAHQDLDRVVAEVIDRGRDLALIALGPTGTILADRLARHGIQALDIGHLSASYMHIMEGAAEPESQPLTKGA